MMIDACLICGGALFSPEHSIFDPDFKHGFIAQKGNTMATKTVDPLAGLPTATAKPVRTPRTKTVASGPAAGTVINLAEAKSQRKRAKLTGQAYKDARDFARSATGYGDTSPIWGKRLPVVLMEIEQELENALSQLQATSNAAAEQVEGALILNRELQKRLATNQLIGAQS